MAVASTLLLLGTFSTLAAPGEAPAAGGAFFAMRPTVVAGMHPPLIGAGYGQTQFAGAGPVFGPHVFWPICP